MTLLLAALAIGGCGSDAPQAPQAPQEQMSAQEREVADGYLALVRDFAAGRHRQFCDALTPESLEITSQNVMGVETTCPEWVEENGALFGENLREQAESTKIESVEIDGDEAVLEWSSEGEGHDFSDRVEAKRIGGRWKYTAITPG